MRILYFYQYFTTPKGAWSTRAFEFARRWVAAGHEVTVVTSVYDKSDLRPSRLFERFEWKGLMSGSSMWGSPTSTCYWAAPTDICDVCARSVMVRPRPSGGCGHSVVWADHSRYSCSRC